MGYLDAAIKMEKEIERFYIELALANKTNSLMPVLLSLALDEANNAQMLSDRKTGMNRPVTKITEKNYEDIFYNLVEFKFQKKNYALVGQFLEALRKEHQSMEIYRKLLSQSEQDRDLLVSLAEQKKEHYDIIEVIILTFSLQSESSQAAKTQSSVACL